MRRGNREGFALLAVLLVLVAVGGLLLDGALRARSERRQAANTVADLRARTAARAGLAHALARLNELQRRTVAPDEPFPGLLNQWNRIGTMVEDLRAVSLPSGSFYTVVLRDASSRLPLNDATEDEFRRLFLALGADFRSADIAAQSILDWRDPDGLHRPRGAEWDDHYRRLDPPIVPRNAPFASVAELRSVRGMEALFPLAAEHFTTFGDNRVNLNTASEPVLRALPGLADEAVALVLARQRKNRPLGDLSELEAQLTSSARSLLQQNFPALARRASFEPYAVEIGVIGWTAGAPLRRTLRALAVRSGSTVQVVQQRER